MRKFISVAALLLCLASTVTTYAQPTSQPAVAKEASNKPKGHFTMSIGGPERTVTVPVNDGATKKVKVGDLIEIGLDPKSPYKGIVSWNVSKAPTPFGKNDKLRSVYFGTGAKPTTVHVTAWGVQQATGDDGKPLPNQWEAYVVAECWVDVEGGAPKPPPSPGPGPDNPPDDGDLSELDKKMLIAWSKDKATGSIASLQKLAATFDEVATAIENKTITVSPAAIMNAWVSKVRAANIKGSTLPEVKDTIADAMEAFFTPEEWKSNTPLGFDNVGRLTAVFSNLSAALRKCK